MKRFLKSEISLVTFFCFLHFTILGPTLTGCGGSSGSSGSPGSTDDGSTTSYSTATKQASDDSGSASFSATKLGNIESVQVNLTAPNGEAATDMDVYFTEADDGYVMLVIRDPNNRYQSTFITFDVDDLTPQSSSLLPAVYLESGEAGSFGVEVGSKSIAIFGLIIVAGTALATAISAISITNTFREVSGTIDPSRLASGQPTCFSMENLLDHFEIASESAGLIFWTAATMATAGSITSTTGLYELALAEMTDAVKDQIEDKFWDEVAETALEGAGIDIDTKMCWILRLPDATGSEAFDYSKILEMRPDLKNCTSDEWCESQMTETAAVDLSQVDNDTDGYTSANDCNDQNHLIYPGAPEICGDGVIQNCNNSEDIACNVTVTAFLRDMVAEGWPELDDGGSGDVSVIRIGGSFQDDNGEITQARVILNGISDQLINSEYGSWHTYVNLQSGKNRIYVIGESGAYYAGRELTYTNTGTQDDLAIMLSWDECPDLDLYVEEPGGKTVNANNPAGDDGSLVLDCSTGWGPEIYTAESASAGTYTFYVKHAGDGGSCGAENINTTYTIRVMTPYGSIKYTGTLSSNNETGTQYTSEFFE